MLPRNSGNFSQAGLGPEQRTWMAFQRTADGQGGFAAFSPHLYLRGQSLSDLTETASFAAGAAANATETVELTLPENQTPPEWAELIIINHSGAAINWQVAQTVTDFVAGSGTINPVIATSSAQNETVANDGSDMVNIQFPFTTDGPLVVTFTLAESTTNGGSVGAQLRFQ